MKAEELAVFERIAIALESIAKQVTPNSKQSFADRLCNAVGHIEYAVADGRRWQPDSPFQAHPEAQEKLEVAVQDEPVDPEYKPLLISFRKE